MVGIFCLLLALACKENKPQGDEFSWTRAGDRLALVSLESQELLLATFTPDSLIDFMVIDTLADAKDRFHAPAWSDSGEYLLYGKSTAKDFSIFVYSVADSARRQLAQIKFRQENERNSIVAPFWFPGTEQVVWVNWAEEQKTLYSQNLDLAPPRELYRFVCDRLQPQPVPGQDAIAFSLQSSRSARNGLWTVPRAGGQPKQIYPCDHLVNYRWAPDGSQIALALAPDKKADASEYQLIRTNPDGTDQKELARFDQEIVNLAWSPDGQSLAVFAASDSLKNIWVIETGSGEIVCLTFDNAEQFFGWDGPDGLYYGLKPLQQPVELDPDQSELRQTITALLGQEVENLLVHSEKFKPTFLDQNVNAFSLHPAHKAWAAYKTTQTIFLEDPVYYPVVRFSDSQTQFIARDQKTSIVVADQMYRTGNYQEALDFLTRPFGVDLNSANALAQFNADTILASNPKVDQVKSQQSRIDFWRVLATLRKLGKSEAANWLNSQNIRMFDYCRLQSDDSSKNTDDFLWHALNVNSRYGEFTQGIRDLDQILQLDPDDSLLAYAIYTHQAYLAMLGKLPTLAHLKLKGAIGTMPDTEQARKDILDALRLFQQLKIPEKSKVLAELYDAYLTRIPGDAKIYAQVGELYEKSQQPDRAFAAYQKSVALDGKQNDIWRKLFMLAQGE